MSFCNSKTELDLALLSFDTFERLLRVQAFAVALEQSNLSFCRELFSASILFRLDCHECSLLFWVLAYIHTLRAEVWYISCVFISRFCRSWPASLQSLPPKYRGRQIPVNGRQPLQPQNESRIQSSDIWYLTSHIPNEAAAKSHARLTNPRTLVRLHPFRYARSAFVLWGDGEAVFWCWDWFTWLSVLEEGVAKCT